MNNSKGFVYRKSFFLLPLMVVFSISCAKKVSTSLDNVGANPIPTNPKVTRVTYTTSGSTKTITSFTSTSLNLVSDLDSGSCHGSSEITITGTFDNEHTAKWVIVGPVSSDVTSSGNQFDAKICLAAGATLVQIKAANVDGATEATGFPNFSITNSFSIAPLMLKTLGEGHPSYPNPGFRSGSVSPNLKVMKYGNNQLANIAVEGIQGVTLTSATQPSVELATGFIPVLRQASP